MKNTIIISVPDEELAKCNALLDLKAEEDGVKNAGYPEYTVIERYSVTFDDGHLADIALCSGQLNFFCDPVLFNSEGREVCVLDCADTIDGEYPFTDGDNEYVVIIRAESKTKQ